MRTYSLGTHYEDSSDSGKDHENGLPLGCTWTRATPETIPDMTRLLGKASVSQAASSGDSFEWHCDFEMLPLRVHCSQGSTGRMKSVSQQGALMPRTTTDMPISHTSSLAEEDAWPPWAAEGPPSGEHSTNTRTTLL